MPVEVSDFEKDVLERSLDVPVLADFWAVWCGPCKILSPVLEKLETESHGQWILAKIDADQHQDLVRQYGIRGIPSVKLFIDRKVAAEFTGALPEASVRQWLQKVLPDPYRRELDAAKNLLENSNREEAIPILEGVLRRSPGHHVARALLAKAQFNDDRMRAGDLVEGIEEDSEAFADADAIRTLVTLESKLRNSSALPEDAVKQSYLAAIEDLSRNNFESAVDRFIEIIRLNRSYDDDGARKACVAIFRLLGEQHPLPQNKRCIFSGALYS